MNRLLPLMGIVATAFLLVLLSSGLIFTVIVPIPNLFPGVEGAIFTAFIKVGLSALLGMAWVYGMKWITESYLRKKIG